MVTDNIRRIIHNSIKQGFTDAERLLTALVENSVIDDEHPELYTENGGFDQALDLKIQAAVLKEIQRQLAA